MAGQRDGSFLEPLPGSVGNAMGKRDLTHHGLSFRLSKGSPLAPLMLQVL